MNEELTTLLELGWDLVIGRCKDSNEYMGHMWDPTFSPSNQMGEAELANYISQSITEEEKVLRVVARTPGEVIDRLCSMAQHRRLSDVQN